MVLIVVVLKMATKPDDGDIEKRKGKKKNREENAWQFYYYSIVLFPHQFLSTAVVVIVYDFGKHLASSSLFPDCMC